MRRRYLITYDLTDNKCRTKVFNILVDSGEHVQYSVFLCELNQVEYLDLKGKLKSLVGTKDGQILILDLGKTRNNPNDLSSRIESIGRIYEPPCRVTII